MYRQQEKHFGYNVFFHPSICHVCKSTDQSNLVLCARCNMIVYCSEKHRKIHRPHHREICSLIAKFIEEDPEWNTRPLRDHDWIKSQNNFVRKIQLILGRKLKPYEEQMFMCAKSCYVCHRRSNLHTCQQCLSFTYCANHMPSFMHTVHNLTICNMLTLILKLDIKSLDPSVWKTFHVKFSKFPSRGKPPNNTHSFCNRYFPPGRDDYWCLYDHIFTEYVSGPLTLHNALRTTNLFHPERERRTFNIHIIAANYVDRRNFPAWELFLHLLKKTKKLIITMIGPELQAETIKHNVCSRCRKAKKKLILKTFPLLYHKYVSHNYRRPNVIVGFQAELNTGKTWLKSIRAIQAQDCPLLLTAETQNKMQEDIITILDVLGTSIKPTLETKNKFGSLRPCTDFKTGRLMYRNSHLIIYENLRTIE